MSKIINTVTGLVIGGAIGAATGILLAPASGAETRQKIKDNALEVQEKAKAAVEDARERVLESVEHVQGKARHLMVDTGREAKYRASRLKVIGQRVVQEQKASLEHGVESAKDVLKS
jgi:gas vesicle protein